MESCSETTESSNEAQNWIKWYINHRENRFLCEVDEDFINDRFNLTGLNEYISDYQSLIPSFFDEPPDSDESFEIGSTYDVLPLLYGLIHARYIMTTAGLHKMAEKFKNHVFGCCPRVFCYHQSLVPIGISDIAAEYSVRVYCPRCNDVYNSSPTTESNLDGAFFGTGFPHMFFMTFPELRPKQATCRFVPRLYGIKISDRAIPLQIEKGSLTRNNNKHMNGENL